MGGLKGAGGTEGGVTEFFVGAAMFCVGFYLLTSAITVSSGFSWGGALFGAATGSVRVPTGSLLIVFVIGAGRLFFKGDSWLGWFLTLGSVACAIASVLIELHFALRPMSMFDMLLILTLMGGGAGLFAKSLRPGNVKTD